MERIDACRPSFADQMSNKGPWGPPCLPASVPQEIHKPIAAAGVATQVNDSILKPPVNHSTVLLLSLA